jgi:hypothetical protein
MSRAIFDPRTERSLSRTKIETSRSLLPNFFVREACWRALPSLKSLPVRARRTNQALAP